MAAAAATASLARAKTANRLSPSPLGRTTTPRCWSTNVSINWSCSAKARRICSGAARPCASPAALASHAALRRLHRLDRLECRLDVGVEMEEIVGIVLRLDAGQPLIFGRAVGGPYSVLLILG